MKFSSFAIACGLAVQSQAHMEMIYPPPLRSQYNQYASPDIDWKFMRSPLSPNGSDYPCKGYLNVLNTTHGQAAASFEVGKTYNMTISGNSSHHGGSCQASLSFDQGKSWRAIHSFIGNCPMANDSSWNFTIPKTAPSTKALFAWTWFNNIGNREMYMNCAAVNITGGSTSRTAPYLSNYPTIFIANIGNNCSTKEEYDVQFPSPGRYVDYGSNNLSLPIGNNCSVDPGTDSDDSGQDGSGNNTTNSSNTTNSNTTNSNSDKDSGGSNPGINKFWMPLGYIWIILFVYY